MTSSMKMSNSGRAMLWVSSVAVLILMGVTLMRAIELEKERVARADEQEMQKRIPMPAGPRKFQTPDADKRPGQPRPQQTEAPGVILSA